MRGKVKVRGSCERLRRVALGLVVGAGLLASGCSIKGVGDADLSGVADLEVCDGMSLEELMNAKKLSDDCKASLAAFLPKAQDDFQSKVVVVGSEEQSDGSLDVFVYGADETGKALTTADFASAQVRVSVDGSLSALAAGDFSVSAVSEAPGDLLSLALVNDYSGSMSDRDLKTVATMETDMLTYLPPIYEGSVTQFSTVVTQKQAYTSDKDTLLGAVAYDAAFDRDLTALYDGMDAGLDGLVARQRPLKLLVVATDGQENASKSATRADVTSAIADSGVAVVMLGGLFSDPHDLRELAGPRGVYFYTPFYDDARAQIAEFLTALSNLSKVNIPKDQRGDGPVSIDAGDSHGEL